jgi:hypothetical protein
MINAKPKISRRAPAAADVAAEGRRKKEGSASV